MEEVDLPVVEKDDVIVEMSTNETNTRNNIKVN